MFWPNSALVGVIDMGVLTGKISRSRQNLPFSLVLMRAPAYLLGMQGHSPFLFSPNYPALSFEVLTTGPNFFHPPNRLAASGTVYDHLAPLLWAVDLSRELARRRCLPELQRSALPPGFGNHLGPIWPMPTSTVIGDFLTAAARRYLMPRGPPLPSRQLEHGRSRSGSCAGFLQRSPWPRICSLGLLCPHQTSGVEIACHAVFEGESARLGRHYGKPYSAI